MSVYPRISILVRINFPVFFSKSKGFALVLFTVGLFCSYARVKKFN